MRTVDAQIVIDVQATTAEALQAARDAVARALMSVRIEGLEFQSPSLQPTWRCTEAAGPSPQLGEPAMEPMANNRIVLEPLGSV